MSLSESSPVIGDAHVLQPLSSAQQEDRDIRRLRSASIKWSIGGYMVLLVIGLGLSLTFSNFILFFAVSFAGCCTLPIQAIIVDKLEARIQARYAVEPHISGL